MKLVRVVLDDLVDCEGLVEFPEEAGEAHEVELFADEGPFIRCSVTVRADDVEEDESLFTQFCLDKDPGVEQGDELVEALGHEDELVIGLRESPVEGSAAESFVDALEAVAELVDAHEEIETEADHRLELVAETSVGREERNARGNDDETVVFSEEGIETVEGVVLFVGSELDASDALGHETELIRVDVKEGDRKAADDALALLELPENLNKGSKAAILDELVLPLERKSTKVDTETGKLSEVVFRDEHLIGRALEDGAPDVCREFWHVVPLDLALEFELVRPQSVADEVQTGDVARRRPLCFVSFHFFHLVRQNKKTKKRRGEGENTNRAKTVIVGENEMPLFSVVELEVTFLVGRVDVEDVHEGLEKDVDVVEGLLDALLVRGRSVGGRGRRVTQVLEDRTSTLKRRKL